MMGWCLRPDERGRDARPGSYPGVLVTSPNGGKKFFFPGPDKEQALILARMALGDKLKDPRAQIEFGERIDGRGFFPKFTIQEAAK